MALPPINPPTAPLPNVTQVFPTRESSFLTSCSAPPFPSLTTLALPSPSPLPHPRRSALLLVALAAAPSSRPSDPPRPSRSTPRVDGSASPRAAPTRGAPPSPSPSSPRDHTPLLRRDARVLLCCKPLLTRRMCRAKCRRF